MGWTKVGTGTINKSKDEGKGAPYYGKCKLTIDGVEREISIGAWVKEGNNNSKFFSLQFSVKDDAPQSKPAAKQSQEADDDSVPF